MFKNGKTIAAIQMELETLRAQRDEARSIADATLEVLSDTKRELAGAILVQEVLIMRLSSPCPDCNDVGVLSSHEGETLGPCDCSNRVSSQVISNADFEAVRGYQLRVGSDLEKGEHHFIVERKPDESQETPEGDVDAILEGTDVLGDSTPDGVSVPAAGGDAG